MHRKILNKKSLGPIRPVSTRKARGPGFSGPARGPGLVLPSLVCIMRMQDTVCVANSYKYMYENCAGGLLDAIVIVQYMHVLYITCGVVVYNF